MTAGPFSQILICSILILSLYREGVKAQSAPCTTPTKHPGSCVSIERCRNIYTIVSNPTPPSTGIANSLKRAACTLPGVTRSICCQPAEVIPEPPTTTASPASGANFNLLPRDCGRIVTDRISHGNVTQVFSYPWMAVLRYDYNGTIIGECSGSLINKRYILTAAHCLNMEIHSVVLGEHTKGQDIDCNIYHDIKGEEIERDCAGPIEEFGIESFDVHQDYNRPIYSNDIGLIRLDKDVTMNDHIKPICLPVTADLQKKVFENYVVTGWGTTEAQKESNILLEAVLPYVDISECRLKLKENQIYVRLSDNQMCAGGKNKVDSCKGDSGGPLGFSANYNGARFVQFGIVSFGVKDCGQKSVPGVYCRVAAYMDWIAEHIKP
ncbi:serine protease grass-like isoform X3 [Ochlerotatus camptorhynchus]|uniref:serine protease grass-like isoform X3 n=1 Tax=Ochlerotatus camptorhynchus TaxID=644619 RepID=UPI0031D03F17